MDTGQTPLPNKLNAAWIHSSDVAELFNALDNQLRFVGGCVRNGLLGLPITDIDLATPKSPEAVMMQLEEKGIKAVPTGIAHGTVTAVINHNGYEITTLRQDVACDGRHAEVVFTDSWQEDAARRDFTMNAMSADREGVVYDYFTGLEDLENRLVRFVGDADARCREDYLRILRFFRFQSQYGAMPLDEAAYQACKTHAAQIKTLSGERIHNEMMKLLASAHVYDVLSAMSEADIFDAIALQPMRLSEMEQLEQLELAHHIMPSALRRLSVLTRGGDTALLHRLIKCWRMSNTEKKYLESLHHHTVAANELIESQQSLHRLIRALGKDMAVDYLLITCAEANLTPTLDKTIASIYNWDIPVFPVNGEDIKQLGLTEGKAIGAALKEAEKWWEEQGYPADKEAVMRSIRLPKHI